MNEEVRPYLTACPVGCAGGLEATQYLLPEGALLRCTTCGQLLSQCTKERYWQSMEEFDDPQGTLPDQRSVARRFRRSKKFLKRIAVLLKQPPTDIRLLDLGCSSGAFLGAAVKLGFRAKGVEPAPKAAKTAQAAGLNVRHGLLHDAGFADGQFGAITLFEVIEHLKEPLDLLRECRRILRPGGIPLIGTSNAASWNMAAMGARWEYLSIAKHVGHISFYTPHSTNVLAQRAGFSVADIRMRGVRFCEKCDYAAPVYSSAKLAGELLNPLRGHAGQGQRYDGLFAMHISVIRAQP